MLKKEYVKVTLEKQTNKKQKQNKKPWMKLLLCARYALSGSEWLDISLEIWLIAYMQQVIYSSLNTANRFLILIFYF